MKIKRYSAIVASIVCVLWLAACGNVGDVSIGGPAPPPPNGGPGIPPSPIEPGVVGDGRLFELVETIRDRHNLPALGAIIVAEGQIAEQSVSGVRSISSNVSVTTSDRWHIASVAKAMTATLAAIMVEQSLISWTTTPLDVWPEYAASMHPQYQSATIVDLLSHHAGIPTDQGAIPSIALTRDEAPGTVIEKRRLWAKELLELTPMNPVGTYEYANGGYIIVGAMLETITGTPWETLMQDQLFGPLGMTSSGFGAPGTIGQLDQPWGHREQSGSLVAIPPGPEADSSVAIGPAGTVHLSMSDYAKFMFAHLEGERGIPGLVSAETFQFLHQPVRNSSYALGWSVDDGHAWANGPLFFHLGSNLRWLTNAGIIPGLNTGVLIVTNAANDDAYDASDELAEKLLNRILNTNAQ
jgi:CubicO group peptidase (beta-lactamase class C family)